MAANAGRPRRDPAQPQSRSRQATARPRHLEQWLKARGIIGLGGIDTRALTASSRQRQPNAVIAHEPSGKFDLDALKKESARMAGARRMDLVPMVTSGQRSAGRRPRGMGQGTPADGLAAPRGRDRLRHSSAYPAKIAAKSCKVTSCRQTSARGHRRAGARWRLSLQRPRRSGRHGEYAVPVIRDLIDRASQLRHLPRPPDARHRGRCGRR